MKCFPFELNFNVTCWQNRRARIYLDLKDFDVSNIDLSIPIHLILDFTHTPKNIIFDNRDLLVFSDDSSFFELQLWQEDFEGRFLFNKGRDKSSPSMRLEKLGINKNRLFCTIDCDKGLKVHNLFLIGILKVDDIYFISRETHFPPPSSKKKLISDQDSNISFKNHVFFEPYDYWKQLENIFNSMGEYGVKYFFYLNQSVEFAAKIDGRSIQSIREDVNDWIRCGPFSVQQKIFNGVLQNVMEIWKEGFFFSAISNVTSSYLLSRAHFKTGSSHFLIRFSMATKPYFDLEAFYTVDGENVFYRALILYDLDIETQKVVFWINTIKDSIPSKSYNLMNILEYVCLKTLWKPLLTSSCNDLLLPIDQGNNNSEDYLFNNNYTQNTSSINNTHMPFTQFFPKY